MSNFLSKFIEHLFALSPYSRDYDFKDHVVVIGDISDDKRRDFLEELVENDLVERDMNNPMGQLSAGIKCIFVKDEEPSNLMQNQAIYYTEKHENEIVFLKDNIYSQGKQWYKKCNLKEAKIVFAFSKDCDNDSDAFEQDELMSLTSKTVKESYPNLRVMLVLNTEFKQLIDMDSFYNDIESISPREMNDYLLAATLENPGLGTTLQHLLTMKSKQLSRDVLQAAGYDEFLVTYIRDMQSEIYQVQVPDFFVGMSFRKCVQVLYLHGIDINSKELKSDSFIQVDEPTTMVTMIAIETSVEENFMTMEQGSDLSDRLTMRLSKPLGTFGEWIKKPKTPSTQTGAVKQCEENEENKEGGNSGERRQGEQELNSEEKKEKEKEKGQNSQPTSQASEQKKKKTQILINPQNYTIRKNDVAYVICDNHELAISIRLINSVEAEKYKQFLKTYNGIRKTLGSRKVRNTAVEEMFGELDSKLKTKQKTEQNDAKEKGIAEEDSQFSQASEFEIESIPEGEDSKLASSMYDFNENHFPEKALKDHSIIVGRVSKFVNYVNLLRKYSNRPIVLFTQDHMEQDKWTEIRLQMDVDTQECYIFKGQYLNLIHIDQLHIKHSYQILLSTSLFSEDFPDAIGLCFAKILTDYYDKSNFLLELLDDEKLQFLNKNIKLKDVKAVPAFLYQTFMQGNVHFTSMVTGMLARVVYNPSWLRVFQDLAIPKNYEKRVQNQIMNGVKVTKTISEHFKYYGYLQFALLEMKPSMIGISLIKFKIGSKYQEYKLDELMNMQVFTRMQNKYLELNELDKLQSNRKQTPSDPKEQEEQFHQYIKNVLAKFIGHRFVLTNPAFFTPIEEGDYVLVIGNLMKNQEKPNSIQTVNIASAQHIERDFNSQQELPDFEQFEDELADKVSKLKQTYSDYQSRKEFKDFLKKELGKRIKSMKKIDKTYKGSVKLRRAFN